MTSELVVRYPAASDREQIGQFLRHVFPLADESFAELLSDLEDKKQAKAPPRH